MLGIIVWAILIIVMMTIISPEIWIVILVAGAAYLLLMFVGYMIKEKVIMPRLESMRKRRRAKRLARWEEIDRQVERERICQQREKVEQRRQARMFSRGLVWATPTTNEERERAIDKWERKWGRIHPSRQNNKF